MTDNRLVRFGLPAAVFAAFLGTVIVHRRSEDEMFLCDGIECQLGSGASWFATGITLIGPFIALAGVAWTRRAEQLGYRGAKGRRLIPDSEEIVEVLWILVAAYVSYRILFAGPTIEAVDVGRPNSWLAGRLDDSLSGRPLVPPRKSWFLAGVLLGSPFMFSLGGAAAREWYAFQDRRSTRTEVNEDSQVEDLGS